MADTKYEFGKDKNGKIYLIDEIHTPDCSRVWRVNQSKNSPPIMCDKEIIRKELLDVGFSGLGPIPQTPFSSFLNLSRIYLKVAEDLIGKPIEVSDKDPLRYFLKNKNQ